MQYTSSSIQQFLNCRLRYYYSMVCFLAPLRKPWALADGSAFHRGMELRNAGVGGDQIITEVRKEYDDIREELSGEEFEEAMLHQETIVGMVLGHIANVKYDYEYIKPEQELQGVVFDHYKLALKIDGIVKKDGLFWLKEYKTTSIADIDKYKEQLEMNAQVDFYVFAVQLACNIELQGVLYEIIRKPLLRFRKNEEFEEYVKRVREDYVARPDFYYHQKYVYRSVLQQDQFKENLKMVLEDIKTAYEDKRWYPNRASCYRYNRACEFHRLCFYGDSTIREGMIKDYYRIKARLHEELEESKENPVISIDTGGGEE